MITVCDCFSFVCCVADAESTVVPMPGQGADRTWSVLALALSCRILKRNVHYCLGDVVCRFAMPGRQQFRVSGESQLFKNVRTRPILPPTDPAPSINRGYGRQNNAPVVAAALVPTSRVSSGPAALPPSRAGGHSRKSSSASVRSGNSGLGLGKDSVARDMGTEFGLAVISASRSGSPSQIIETVPEPPQPITDYPVEAKWADGDEIDGPTTVDEDGVYTVPVPGAGRCVVVDVEHLVLS